MMEEYRKDVMKALEAMLGEGYEITPQDRRDNNCPVLHGICCLLYTSPSPRD